MAYNSGTTVNNIRDADNDTIIDSTNDALRVNLVAGGGSGGTALADEAGFTEGTTSFTPVGGVYNETLTTPGGEDWAAAARITPARGLHVNLRDAAGAEVSVGGGTQYTEDAAAAANPVGTAQILVRQDTPATLVTTDGDNVARRGTDYGAAYTQIITSAGAYVDTFGGGTQYTEDAAAAANPVGNALIMVRDDALSGQTTTDGDNIAARGTDLGELYVKHVDAIPVTDNAGSLTVDNAVLSVVGGGTEATAQRVTIATDSTGVLSVDDNGGNISIDDGGNVITVDGTVAVSSITTAIVPGTGATNLGKAEDAAHTTGDVGVMILGIRDDTLDVRSDTENDYEPFHMTATGRLYGSVLVDTALPAGTNNIGDVDVLTIAAGDNNIGNVDIASIAAGDNNIGNVDIVTVPAPLSTTGGGTEATALRVTVATDSTGVLSVDDNGGSLTIDNAQLSVVGGGTEATAVRVTIASDSTGVLSIDDNGANISIDDGGNVITVDGTVAVTQATATNLNAAVVGSVAHDTGTPGNPIVIAGSAQDSDDTAPPNRVSAEADVTRLATDRDGSLHVLPFGPQIWSYHEDSSSALTDTEVHAAAGSGLSLYVGTLVVSTGAATAMNIFFEEASTKKLGPYYLEAVAGRGLAIQFNPPKKMTANTALTVTTSAAIAHSIDVTGYVAQG